MVGPLWYVNVVDTNGDASIDKIYVTYVDDEHADFHDYDDDMNDDHDRNYDITVRALNARVSSSTNINICVCVYIYIYIYIYIHKYICKQNIFM